MAKRKDRAKVGTFRLGAHNVRLVVDFTETGGTFNTGPVVDGKPKGTALITVGATEGLRWAKTLNYLLHEAMEAALAWENRRLVPDDGWGSNHADYIFHFDHNGFTRACEQVAYFMAEAVPALTAAVNARWHPPKAKRKRKRGK